MRSCEIIEEIPQCAPENSGGPRLRYSGAVTKGNETMFSASLEIVLAIAYREAVSRRHAYVTLEHLLYALAYDPDGERILVGCGADLQKLRRDLNAYLEESIVPVARGQERQPEQ